MQREERDFLAYENWQESTGTDRLHRPVKTRSAGRDLGWPPHGPLLCTSWNLAYLLTVSMHSSHARSPTARKRHLWVLKVTAAEENGTATVSTQCCLYALGCKTFYGAWVASQKPYPTLHLFPQPTLANSSSSGDWTSWAPCHTCWDLGCFILPFLCWDTSPMSLESQELYHEEILDLVKVMMLWDILITIWHSWDWQ